MIDEVKAIGTVAKGVAMLAEKFGLARQVDRFFDPIHAKRINEVECENRIRNAKTDIEVVKIRAEAAAIDQQINKDVIVGKAAEILPETAKLDALNRDWANHVGEKIKLVEDEDMRRLWAKLIAGEAEKPGSFTKRTVDEVARLNKEEADAFTVLAGFVWKAKILECGFPQYDGKEEYVLCQNMHVGGSVFEKGGLLDDANLVKESSKWLGLSGALVEFEYYGRRCEVVLKIVEALPHSPVCQRSLTEVGRALVPICGGEPVDGEFDRVVAEWRESHNFIVMHVDEAE